MNLKYKKKLTQLGFFKVRGGVCAPLSPPVKTAPLSYLDVFQKTTTRQRNSESMLCAGAVKASLQTSRGLNTTGNDSVVRSAPKSSFNVSIAPRSVPVVRVSMNLIELGEIYVSHIFTLTSP